jgi:hypothetical protein
MLQDHRVRAERLANDNRAIELQGKKVFRHDVIAGVQDQMIALWGLRVPGIRGRFTEFVITGCTLTGQADVVRHTDKVSHEFLMFRVNPFRPIDFSRNLFAQRPTILKPAFAGMQVDAGSDERFLQAMTERVDWVMASPITCLEDLVEPFCAGTGPDCVDLYGFLGDEPPAFAA